MAVVAWTARVLTAVPRSPSRERIDPFTLAEPWRGYVREALQAQARFQEAVGAAREGPLRDRLSEVEQRLDTGVRECWRIARNAQSLSDARRAIDVARITAELTRIGENASESWAAGSALARTAESLEAQLESAGRLDRTVSDAESRLRLLDTKLDEAVTRAIELSAQTSEGGDLEGLEGDVDSVVTDMEALRQALEEAGTASSGPGGIGPPPADDRPLPGGET